jgi:eukaryotic-like serine/threonine-protein kinase
MASSEADRDLLFGILALQNGLVDQADLIAAFQTWSKDKSGPLALVLVNRGSLTEERRAVLNDLVRMHLERHGEDSMRSLAAVGLMATTVASFKQVGDPALNASLACITKTGSGNSIVVDDGRSTTQDYRADSNATSAVGRYRILRSLARGGIGIVSVALDTELHREVALKEIQPERADDPASRARFLLEAEVTGRLEHPGVVPMYGLGASTEGRPYYAMRLVRGESLQEAINRFHAADRQPGRAPGERALELRKLLGRFTDVCDVVAYAHSRGVIHRDIKPLNILLGPYGETLLVDWGLAKIVGRNNVEPGASEATLRPEMTAGSSETVAGTVIGTPAYMSPEQAEGRLEAIGAASDIYSLGATLFCLLTGRLPIEGKDVAMMIRQVQQGEFPLPRVVNHRVPAPLEAVVLQAMALRPESRYISARALAEELNRWIADEPVSAFPDPLPRRCARWASQHRLAVRTAVMASIISVLLYTYSSYVIFRRQAQALNEAKSALDRNDKVRRNVAEREEKQHQLIEASNILQSQVAWLQEQMKNQPDRPGWIKFHEAFLRQQFPYFIDFIKHDSHDPTLKDCIAKAHCQVGLLHVELGERDEALASYTNALKIWSSTYYTFDGRANEYSSDYLNLYMIIGKLQKDLGQLDQAAQSYELAIATLKHYNTPCETIMSLYHDAGELLKKSGRPTESLRNYVQAIQTLESKPECVRVANGLDYLYKRACFLGLCSDAIAQGALSQDGTNQIMYASQAMMALRKAVDAGYKDLEHMMVDTDLSSLRSREDFKELLSNLRSKTSSQ